MELFLASDRTMSGVVNSLPSRRIFCSIRKNSFSDTKLSAKDVCSIVFSKIAPCCCRTWYSDLLTIECLAPASVKIVPEKQPILIRNAMILLGNIQKRICTMSKLDEFDVYRGCSLDT